jgi:hypothetical protein
LLDCCKRLAQIPDRNGPARYCKAFSIMDPKAKKRAELLFQKRQEGKSAIFEYEARDRATRELTAKLRAERLAREEKVKLSGTLEAKETKQD